MSETALKKHWLGFDLGGTKMLSQVYREDWTLIGRDRRKTKATADSHQGLERIAETIEASLAAAETDAKSLAGIGIGCPGPVNMDLRILVEPPNLPWKQVPVGDWLQERFGCPVTVLNDVDAGVYAEYCFGRAKSANCVVGVFPGTGIGGGCVYRGEILRGTSATCMEIGHVQVIPNGPLCGCGQRGCLEAVASRLAIAANAAKAAFRGEAPELAKSAGADIAKIRSGAIAASIASGDLVVEQITREAARQIGIAVAGVIHILCPDVIVLGGGLVEAMPGLFIDVVSKTARKRVMPAYRETFKVVAASLEDDAGARGAAAWARHTIEGAKPQ